MNKEKITSLTSINEVHIVRRIIAAVLDLALAVFAFFALMAFVAVPIANKATNYSQLNTDYIQYQCASHLFLYQQSNNDSTVELIEVKDYEKKIDQSLDSRIVALSEVNTKESNYFLEHIHYFYLCYLTGENIELPESNVKTYNPVADKFVSPNYDKPVDESGILPKDYYTEEYFNKNILLIESEGQDYFSVPSISERASIREGVDDNLAIKYLTKVASRSINTFYYSDYIQQMNKQSKIIEAFIIFVPYLIVVPLVYLLPTLLFKNGETLGKITMHVAVISKDGYKARKSQFVFRFLVLFVEMTLSFFIVGIGVMSFVTAGVGAFILLVATLISKSHRAPHDYAAATYEIDAKTSVWFASKEDEQKHVDEFNENISSYNDVNEVGKNVIQIKGEIIDPTLKAEHEKKKKQN